MEVNNYDPVADLYDIYVPVTFDLDFFLKETKQAEGQVLELMSGTGRVSIPLIQAGVQLTCADISAESNRILKDKLRRLGQDNKVIQMDIRELDLSNKFAMIIIPFHSFAHLTSPLDQKNALTRIRAHLNPGGIFICTLLNPLLRKESIDGQLRLARKYDYPKSNGTLLLWILENVSAADGQAIEALQFYEVYDERGVLVEKRQIEIHFRLVIREDFEALAAEAGFRIKAFYGDYALGEFKADSPYMIWVLEAI